MSYRLKNARFFLPNTSKSSQIDVTKVDVDEGRLDTRLTHGNTKQTQPNLNASNDIKCLQNTGGNEPVISTPSQAKAEHVLENQ